MMDPNVRKITAEEHRINSQIGVYKLAREAFWRSYDACLTPILLQCENLTHRYCPEVWDQYKEGLITASSALNKLLDEMSHTDGKFMPPIDRLAAEGLLARIDNACRKFAKGIKPLADQLQHEAPIGDSWGSITSIEQSAFLFCNAVGQRLCDLDRDTNLS